MGISEFGVHKCEDLSSDSSAGEASAVVTYVMVTCVPATTALEKVERIEAGLCWLPA